MNSIEFRAALRDLQQGRVPANMGEVIKYVEDGVLETKQLVASLTACADRQDKTIQLLRAFIAGLERQERRSTSKPQWVGPSAEMIPGTGEG